MQRHTLKTMLHATEHDADAVASVPTRYVSIKEKCICDNVPDSSLIGKKPDSEIPWKQCPLQKNSYYLNVRAVRSPAP